MPKRVDHAERRAHISHALVRVAAREGLHAVTMRAVAAEAGTSVNLVQYYFASKARLMHGALEYLERQSHERWARLLTQRYEDEVTGEGGSHPRSAREGLTAFVEAALPSDSESNAFHLVWSAYATLAMTDSELAEQPFVEGPNRLERQLTEILTAARTTGELAADRDPATEAATLLSLNHGVGTSVLVGQRSLAQARQVLRYHLTRLFDTPDRPAR